MSDFDDVLYFEADNPIDTESAVEKYLQKEEVNFSVVKLEVSDDLLRVANDNFWPLANVVRAQLVADEEEEILLVTTADCVFDFPKICQELEREVETKNNTAASEHFDSCLKSMPPLPGFLTKSCAYNFSDKFAALPDEELVYFPSGEQSKIISIQKQDLIKLLGKAWSKDIIEPRLTAGSAKASSNVSDSFSQKRFRKRVGETFELPAMPKMADELLKLRVDKSSKSSSLAKLISKDPSLSAQLISWALSPYYNYPGKINSVEDAIVKVLGYDLVLNISLGIALSQMFRLPEKGQFGWRNNWLTSVYAAVLMETLWNKLEIAEKPNKGLVYLSGLLHNFGFILLGHLAPPQLQNLNQAWELNPSTPILELERMLLNTTHQEMGKDLMEAWNMPEELIVVAANHHNPNYKGKHEKYVHMTYLADSLLASKGVGEGQHLETLPKVSLDALDLKELTVQAALSEFWQKRSELYDLVHKI